LCPGLFYAATAGFILWAAPARAAGADQAEPNELAEAEAAVRHARVGVDGSSLLAFFRQRTLAEAQRQQLAAVVKQLGDDDFAVRTKAYRALLTAGRSAVPFLRSALRDPDPEITGSAKKLLARLEDGSDTALMLAAARVLSARKPAAATQVLLAYLPQAADDTLEEAVFHALARVGVEDGKVDPLLKAALKDKNPLVRLAAAHVYGRGEPELRKALPPLLADADPRVRLHVAGTLAHAGDKAAIPVLIALLGDGPLELAWPAEDMLCRLAGDQAVPAGLGSTPDERRQCRDAWALWWKTNAAKADLALLAGEKALLGRNLVCECGAGKHPQGYVWEFGRDGKMRWEFDNVNTPVDVQILPNGRVLVATWGAGEVTERDQKGKVLWTYRTTSATRSCQRLANGNTFIATTNELLEVTRAGKKVFSQAPVGMIHRARKLRNGQFVYINSAGQIGHLDRTGRTIRTVAVNGQPGSFADVDLLPNGRYLVGFYQGNQVVEVNNAGKILWTLNVNSPSSINRLPNGNTVVASMNAQRVVEFNRAGKEIWSQRTPGRPFCVRRY
jgi:HEAT repeat protein/outer membrane protein assembly factor BamB